MYANLAFEFAVFCANSRAVTETTHSTFLAA